MIYYNPCRFSTRLYRYVGGRGLLTLIVELITVLYCIYLGYKLLQALRREKKDFCKDRWHLVEVGKLVLAVASIVTKIVSLLKVKHAVETLKNEGQ